MINKEAIPRKNATLYKTHKVGTPVRLLTTGCNSAIENLSRFIEAICAPLTENMQGRIKNTQELLNIIDDLNQKELPNNTLLVSFDIVSMFPSIDNDNGVKAVEEFLDQRKTLSHKTECIIEGLKICLFNNNSKFDNQHLLQTNGTATGAPNSCSYADIAVSSIDKKVFISMSTSYKELIYYGR